MHVSAPMGDFTLDRKNHAGGADERRRGRHTDDLHAVDYCSPTAASGASLSFTRMPQRPRARVPSSGSAKTAASHSNVKRVVFYEAVDAGDRRGVDYDFDRSS